MPSALILPDLVANNPSRASSAPCPPIDFPNELLTKGPEHHRLLPKLESEADGGEMVTAWKSSGDGVGWCVTAD